jgi:small subunit ribosomal protein S20
LANIQSAIKRARQTIKHNARNRARRARMRTYVLKARGAMQAGDQEEAETAVRVAISEIDRAVSKGVLHRNAAARRKSQLMKRLNTLS